jgi:protein involved in polysaccharide export with SLBB domain
MRFLAGFLILCLVLPFMPSRLEAQLVTSPVNLPANGISNGTSLSADIPKGSISSDYVLGAGDQLEAHLIVGDNALVLDYTFVINPEGKIFFPNVSEMALSGLTLKQAKQKMIRSIKIKYFEKFSLSLMVSVPKRINVYITGQVSQTGLHEGYDGSRVSDILKKVGMAKGGSDLSEFVHLKRKTNNGSFENYKLTLHDIFLENDGKQNMKLENGDILAIPAIKSYVYVYGEVARSGTFGFVPGQTLSDYINSAGGPTVRANLSGVTVTRQENGKPKVYHINASDVLRKGMDDKDIEIYAGDVVSVPGNFFYIPDFTSFLNTILLTLTLYSTVSK